MPTEEKSKLHLRQKGIGVLKIALFFVLMGAILWKTYDVLSWKDTSGDYLSSMEQLYHTPKNQMDVVFLGSSHCYCGIYPAVLWERAGISAFDMAVSGQDKDSTVHALEEVLKTQKPKVVMVEMYGLCFDRHAIEGNEYRNMLSMRTSLNSLSLVHDYVEPEKRADFYLRWPIIHTRFWEVQRYDYVLYEPSAYGRGAVFNWHTYEEDLTPGEYENKEIGTLTEKNQAWLEKLLQQKEEGNFELVFFLMPFKATRNDMLQINAAKKFAEEKGIPFWDFNETRYEIGLDDEWDYVDDFHCNHLGAEKVTDVVCDYLKTNYELADHRGQAEYSCWEKDAAWYHHDAFRYRFRQGMDRADYIAGAAAQEEVLCIISVEWGEEEVDLGQYEELLAPFHLDAEELEQGGKWIYQNGTLTKVVQNEKSAQEYCADLNSLDALRIRYTGERVPSDIRINYTDYLMSISPVTVVVYDLFLKEPVSSICF